MATAEKSRVDALDVTCILIYCNARSAEVFGFNSAHFFPCNYKSMLFVS